MLEPGLERARVHPLVQMVLGLEPEPERALVHPLVQMVLVLGLEPEPGRALVHPLTQMVLGLVVERARVFFPAREGREPEPEHELVWAPMRERVPELALVHG